MQSPRDSASMFLRVDGQPFGGDHIEQTVADLEALDDAKRRELRNHIAVVLTTSSLPRILIVAGPGTGKSHVFKGRIQHWLGQHEQAEIYVSTFVRKLSADLAGDIRTEVPEDQRRRVTVRTLHSLARGLVEKAGGTAALPCERHISMIARPWVDLVWGDAAAIDPLAGGMREVVEQELHAGMGPATSENAAARAAYFRVCQYYNAMGFADSILHATEVVEIRPELFAGSCWIFDEFQDFNAAEDRLVRACSSKAEAVLLAGDDDQALYQVIKESHPEIIRSYYADTTLANALLPFCGRCSHHIVQAAAGFLRADPPAGSIPKVFLPVERDEAAERVHIVACSQPKAAVNYIERFIGAHRDALVRRKQQLGAGEPADPYLLILSRGGEPSFLAHKGQAQRLALLVEEWASASRRPGSDFLQLLMYCAAGQRPRDNFAVRKALSLKWHS